MTEHDLQYPVITFSRNIINIERSMDKLTKCSDYALYRGYFKEMFIIDSSGAGYIVLTADRVGKESLWDNIFSYLWSKTITIELKLEKVSINAPVEQIKEKLSKSFQEETSWSSGDNFEELSANISRAQTTHEVMEALKDWME